ncbi:MAG: flagellar basal body P-ring protein FlgI [Planctomycetota bacterium]
MTIKILTLGFLVLLATQAAAVQVRDIARLKGSETNKLIGMGLVTGLNGTGDGGDYVPAARQMAAAIRRFNDPNVAAEELADADSFALVALSVEVPAEGVAEGDRLDVSVTTIGPAESLAGGELFVIPMTGPIDGAPVMAYASGLISIPDDDNPTAGVIEGGAQMVRDILSQPMDEFFRLRIVLDETHAGWPTASAVAAQINGSIAPDGPMLAQAVDGKNILITVPMVQRREPAQFINDVLTTFIDMSFVEGGAKVVINQRTGAIVVSGDVRVSPMLISHEALTITTLDPAPVGNAIEPVVTEHPFAAMDPDNRGGTRLADLLAAFNQLKVSAKDRIDIIKTMHDSGKLHAKLIIH